MDCCSRTKVWFNSEQVRRRWRLVRRWLEAFSLAGGALTILLDALSVANGVKWTITVLIAACIATMAAYHEHGRLDDEWAEQQTAATERRQLLEFARQTQLCLRRVDAGLRQRRRPLDEIVPEGEEHMDEAVHELGNSVALLTQSLLQSRIGTSAVLPNATMPLSIVTPASYQHQAPQASVVLSEDDRRQILLDQLNDLLAREASSSSFSGTP